MSDAGDDPRKTTVRVLDESFTIRTEADTEYTRRVARHVDGRLRALRDAAPSLEPFPTAVLGAMEITDALFRDQDQAASDRAALVERLEQLAAEVETAVGEVVGD